MEEAEAKQREADRCARDGTKARRELERHKKAIESMFEDLQRQVHRCETPCNAIIGTIIIIALS